jgi:hypothetical protein
MTLGGPVNGLKGIAAGPVLVETKENEMGCSKDLG